MHKRYVDWDNVRIVVGILILLTVGFCFGYGTCDKSHKAQTQVCRDNGLVVDSLLNEQYLLDSMELASLQGYVDKHHGKMDSLSGFRQRALIHRVHIRDDIATAATEMCGP